MANVRELPPCMRSLRRSLPSIVDLVQEQPFDDQSRIVSYLAEGALCRYLIMDPGLVHDVVVSIPTGQRAYVRDQVGALALEPLHPEAIVTDGEWVWFDALRYYIARYNISVPYEFIAHAAGNGFRIDRSKIDVAQLDASALTGNV